MHEEMERGTASATISKERVELAAEREREIDEDVRWHVQAMEETMQLEPASETTAEERKELEGANGRWIG